MARIVDDIAAWDAASADARLAAAKDVAARLHGFEPTGEIRGSRGLPELRHVETRTRFVLIPGGTFEMGLREGELDEIHSLAKVKERAGRAAIVKTALQNTTPSTTLAIRSFLCGRTPMLEGAVPVQVDTGGALRAAQDFGWRPPRASEWEYVAREGGRQAWVCATSGTDREIRRALDLSGKARQFSPATDINGITNGFGVWGMYLGEWVLEEDDAWPTEPNASRGGPQLYPFQGEPAEIAWAHAAVHRRGRTFRSPCYLRFVVDLPS